MGDDPTTNDWNGRGFKSEKSAKGGLRHQFDTPGDYYYSSQSVFGKELYMKGIIRVVKDTEDSTSALSVKMQNIPAVQQVKEDSSAVEFDDCSIVSNTNCASDPVSSDQFLFTTAVCLTPEVNSIEITSGYSNASTMPLSGFNGAELVITGNGFSENMCQNLVTLGDNSF